MAAERKAYATLQLFGLALIATAFWLVVIVSLILFPEDVGGFLVTAVVASLAVGIVWRFDATWARAVGLLLGIAVPGGWFFLAFGILQPLSPLEFTVGSILVLGFLFALVFGVMAIVAGVRGRGGPLGWERMTSRVTVVVLGVAIVGSVVGFLLTRTEVDAATVPNAAELDMVDFAFDPSPATIEQGQQLVVRNLDAFAHDFTLEDEGISVHVGPGNSTIVDVSALAPGTYDYVCSLHIDPATGEGMTGELTITD